LDKIRYIKRSDGRGTRKQLWRVCPYCGKARWIYPSRSGVCQACSARKKRQIRRGKTSWGDAQGYLVTSVPLGDPLESMLSVDGRCREHRLVMARYLGRPLVSREVVHHKNGNRSDNRLENLELLDKREHDRIETTRRWQENGSLSTL